MTEIKAEIAALFSKMWVLMLYIVLSGLAKISHYIMQGKKMSFLFIVASFIVSIYIAGLSYRYCKYKEFDENIMIIVVSICVLLSDRLMIIIYGMDYKQIWSDLISIASKYTKK